MGIGTAVKARASWLGRPWFFVAVAVLALNDHVLKGMWPGWLTGKLSDFAGLLVVATLVAVLSGPMVGTILSGLAFVALKTVPGVAEFLAPVLGGGVTLRDASDLVALVVLPPLWRVLRRERPDQAGRTRRGWIAVGLVAGVLATTATTPGPAQDEAHDLSARGDVFTVWIPRSAGFDAVYLASSDGGRTWSATDKTSGTPNPVESVNTTDLWSRSACASDGTCYRAVITPGGADEQRQVVERRDPGQSAWSLELDLPPAERPSGLAVATDGGVIVQTGERTIRYRAAGGEWLEADLVAIASPPQWERDYVNAVGTREAALVIAGILAVFGIVVAPGRGRIAAVVVNAVIGVGLYWAGWIVLGFFLGQLRMALVFTVWAVVVVVWIVVARVRFWRRRAVEPEVDLR